MGGISMSPHAIPHTETVTVWVDGVALSVPAGVSIAAALLSTGLTVFRRTPRRAEPRGLFCGMGSCYDCIVAVDGAITRTCITPVTPGIRIGTQGSDDQ